jgi:hypothetical protein
MFWLIWLSYPLVAVVAQTCATDGSDYSYGEDVYANGVKRKIETNHCPSNTRLKHEKEPHAPTTRPL